MQVLYCEVRIVAIVIFGGDAGFFRFYGDGRIIVNICSLTRTLQAYVLCCLQRAFNDRVSKEIKVDMYPSVRLQCFQRKLFSLGMALVSTYPVKN